MFSRARLLVAAALVVGGAAACSDLTGFNGTADGSYFLQTVNGNPLPYSFFDNTSGSTITVLSGTYALNSNRTYTALLTYRITTGSQTSTGSQSESGDWTQSGNSVTFTPTFSDVQDYTVYSATIANSSSFGGSRTLRTSVNGLTAVYSD
jgi:hypothetical protein